MDKQQLDYKYGIKSLKRLRSCHSTQSWTDWGRREFRGNARECCGFSVVTKTLSEDPHGDWTKPYTVKRLLPECSAICSAIFNSASDREACIVMTVSVCLSVCLETAPRKDDESARDNHILACNFAKYSLIYKKNSSTDSAINQS